ncbi:MAG TPA: hypothetical protein VHD91_03225 [Gaiellaceae bacterium]|nr:hypothetical protein [Gaiellaceae bacterium]
MDEFKPVWTNASYLLYAGGLTILGAAVGALAYLSANYGDAAYAGWSLLILAVLVSISDRFHHAGRKVAAGIFVFAALIAWIAFLAAVWTWFGWLHKGSFDSLAGFSFARLSLLFLVLLAAWNDRRKYGFPFVRAVSAVAFYVFVLDLLSSGSGDWAHVLTLLVGLAYLAGGSASDEPSAFWLHLVGGVLIGAALLEWWHTSDWQWTLICLVALVYTAIGSRTGRSSWSVLASIGLLAASTHFAIEWTHVHLTLGGLLNGNGPGLHGKYWVPSCVFAFTGFLLVWLGLRERHRAP